MHGPLFIAEPEPGKQPQLTPPALVRPQVTRAGNAHNSVRIPIEPLQDSLLLRSTFNALEHTTSTLKRMSKAVLASTSSYLALLEQVEKAEDDLFAQLGDLGHWLESGYGLSEHSVWDGKVGIRKVRKGVRRREREEIEVMVEQSLRTAKSEMKRNGLAGGTAQTRFEVS
jgi:hypothetical protein